MVAIPNVFLNVNGKERRVKASIERTLLSVLRDELRLTGTKYGCGEGSCGACTVLLAGSPARSCVLSLGDVAGRPVTTIEGLTAPGRLHPVQRAFAELGAMQCGYCTPGMVLTAVGLLAVNSTPSDSEIVEAMSHNICRCCAYPRILQAVRAAADMGGHRGSPRRLRREPSPLPLDKIRLRTPWDLTPVKARRYFSILPNGLVVVLESAGGEWMSTGGAWIHVGANGVATAFTGKVDVGQDSRTALALLVAEELRTSFESVRMVMGDTDFCPYDMGTFGSQSMPGAGEDLRTLGAATRGKLEAMAARHKMSAGWTSYRKLLSGIRRVEVVKAASNVTPPADWSVAGTPTVRPAAARIVTGALRYPSDLRRPRMMFGKVVRPPALGAKLVSVDLTGAQALRGVVAMRDGDFVGVAAPDPESANRALAAVDARWEAELQPNERSLFEDLRSNPVEVEGWFGAFHHKRGNPERALKAAPIRISETYTTAYLAHAPMETRSVLAEWFGRRLTVWVGCQTPFMVREGLAEELKIDESRVRVIVPPTGGGFGGKHVAGPALEAARLARAAGRPVKLTWTREEEFRWGYFRPAALIDVESGSESDGTITAWRHKNFNSGRAAIETPYEIPNERLDYQPTEAPLPQGAYRSLAAVANSFARESHIDEIARRVDRDPLELRLALTRDERLADVLRAAAERAGWANRVRGGGRGMGIAGSVEKGGRVATCVEVEAEQGRPLRILKLITAYECGAMVNPDTVRNQVEGGVLMALGGALFEQVHFNNGKILNDAFSSYRVPRAKDVPPVEVVLLDRRDIAPAGAGETPLLAVAPALANAIHEACGLRLRSLPLVPTGIVVTPRGDSR